MRVLPFLCALFLPGAAMAQKVSTGDQLKSCLYAQAVLYGAQSCHAPTELMPAIYASCEVEQKAVMEVIERDMGQKVADKTLDLLHKKLDPELTKFIIDGQIERQCP
jgi:hypothetical protein